MRTALFCESSKEERICNHCRIKFSEYTMVSGSYCLQCIGFFKIFEVLRFHVLRSEIGI